jgi:hypothetical protein
MKLLLVSALLGHSQATVRLLKPPDYSSSYNIILLLLFDVHIKIHLFENNRVHAVA